MIGADSFSSSYSEAREKFQEAVAAARGSAESFKHPRSGPGGEELAVDAAWFGPSDASRVLILISGTHGIEGYCGSGAQVDWLRREEFKLLPADTCVLMIHAINPYGFAWTRRVNEDNVDLNRNWVDFSEPPPPNPGYVELAVNLCPSEWTAEAQEATARNMAAWQASHGAQGAADFRQAVTGGQYTHPLGLFFGGSGPSWSRRTQTAILQKYLTRETRWRHRLSHWAWTLRLCGTPDGFPAGKTRVQARGGMVRSGGHVDEERNRGLEGRERRQYQRLSRVASSR